MSDEKQQKPVGSKVKTATGFEREYTEAEVAQHNREDDCWIIIHGRVYDVTGFLVDHPGGPEIITAEAGTDATAKFEEVFHSDDARRQLPDFCVGTVAGYQGDPDAVMGKKKSSTGTAQAVGGTSPLVYVVALGVVGALAYFFVL